MQRFTSARSLPTASRFLSSNGLHTPDFRKMGNNRRRPPPPAEHHLLLPPHPTVKSAASIIDTHTHIAPTFAAYKHKYKGGVHETCFDFIRAMCRDRNIEAIVDVWCDAPVKQFWKELANSALTEEDRERNWAGIQYWFVMGVHPHEASLYIDETESDILEAMAHPRCVGWGEIGLDYHYNHSPPETQKTVFTRQLRLAVMLGKPLTIHTREAEEDTERILKLEVPKEHRIHIHCFTDSPAFAERLLNHFPNLYIGITGVITYSTNVNTSNVVSKMFSDSASPRILLETDAPYMVPGNIYSTLTAVKGKLPLCHSAMIPWTADFVAKLAGDGWSSEKVIHLAQENAKKVYGI